MRNFLLQLNQNKFHKISNFSLLGILKNGCYICFTHKNIEAMLMWIESSKLKHLENPIYTFNIYCYYLEFMHTKIFNNLP